MKIKKFNESIEEDNYIYCVTIFDYDGEIDEHNTKSFYDEMMAADYFIKYVNKRKGTKYEPFFEGDNRLFISTIENTDWEECYNYISRSKVATMTFSRIKILTKPQNF